MASTKVTYVTGTAEIRRRDPSHDPQATMPQPEQHFVTEPSTPLQVAYVDGKCTCCPYGYHIDLDFLNFCSDLESASTLTNLKRIQRTKRNLRKSMEIMLNEQEGIKADPNSAPPDIVKSTEAERLMHMVNFEQSATVNILRQIDTSVRTDMASFESRATWSNQAKTEDNRIPSSHNGPSYKNPPVVVLTRADSWSSLSSSSTMSSEAALVHQAELVQQHQTVHNSRTVTKVVEQRVLEMATAEMKHYSTTSSAQLADVNIRVDAHPPVSRNIRVDETDANPPVSRNIRVDETDANPPVSRKMKQHFVNEVSATYRTPTIDSPREPPDVSETSVQPLREALTSSLQRIKVLEEQVKSIPILQVRISVLKEEKRLLHLQLKASKSSTTPLTSTVGVGDDSIEFNEEKDSRIFGHSASTTIATSTPKKDLMIKSPPPTLPKPTKTASIAVGNHSVLEPYNLQPHLPTGYTIRENETAFGIYSKTLFDKESLTVSRNQKQLLNSTVQQITSKDKNTSNIFQTTPQSNQSNVTVNQMQKSSSEGMTRTVGVGDANVFEDSKMHVHEKELRTVIFGQNNAVAKRNVGIECRVPTRDVGVLFICDEEKPATRTIGVNVNYDTSGIFTSLDFKGERELRVALQGVLHRSVHSVGTSCKMTEATVECATMTDASVGVSVGCGNEDQRVDVEVRPAVVRKSAAVTCKPDVGHKYVSTDADWVRDASTITYQVDSFDKGLMTEKVKQAFASTNTVPVFNHAASIQTDHNVFISLGQVRHTASNTANIVRYSTGVMTDIITTHNAYVNTVENVSELFNEAFKKESVDGIASKESLQWKTDRRIVNEGRTESSEKFGEDKDTREYAASRISDAAVQEKVTHEHSDHESLYLGKSEYTKKSSKYDYGNTHYTSLEVSSHSVPGGQGHISSKKITSGQEDLNNNASILQNVEPGNTEERFSETVVEHFILTKDGKKLISEEKVTTSSAGTNRSFKQYAHNHDHTMEGDTGSNQRSAIQSINTDESQTGSWSKTNTHTYNSDTTNEFSMAGNSNICMVSNQHQDAERLANVSSVLDSNTQTKNSLSNFESKKSEKTVYYQESGQNVQKSETTGEVFYKMRRAGSVEDFMPNDIRKYLSINPAASKDSGLDSDLINILSSDSIKSTTSEIVVTSDANGKKTSRLVNMKKISKSGALSALPEINSSQDSDIAEDDKKEVVEETFVKSEASFCGEQSESSGQDLSSSATTTTTDVSRFLQNEGQIWSSLSSCAIDERSFDSLTTSSTVTSTDTVRVTIGESKEVTEGIHTDESFKGNTVLKSIMKHSTETQCANTKKAITFADTVTGGTGSSSEEDNNCSDADSTDSFDEGSYDGQEIEAHYSKEEGSPSQGSAGVQVLDQNIRDIYELSDEVKNACLIVGTYLTDSTSIQTKQLNASQDILLQEWFQLSSHKLSSAHKVEDFLSSVNEISNRLLEYIINMADANGNTAIHYCISHCNLDIASLLLDSKVCDTNRRNKAGYTPIMLAGLATVQDPQQYDVIRRLLSLGEVNARATQTQQTALMLAASHGRQEMVKLLIEEGAEINLQDEDGSTALMCACEHGHLEIVNTLLMHPAIDVNLTDCEKSTALSVAMETGHKDIGVVLYKHLNFPKVTSLGSHKKREEVSAFPLKVISNTDAAQISRTSHFSKSQVHKSYMM